MSLPVAELDSAYRLVEAVQQLSLARNLDQVMEIVRHAARSLTGADGATFVLRDGGYCFYADEDAISPLWKGRRFPLETCISGWVMLHREPAAIVDIYADPRIPADAYRPTFVKSLAMVPIRSSAPIGAIGNYWAEPHEPTAAELRLLQALADSTSVALENVQLYGELEQRVRDRTAELELANRELEAFSYTVSHDLRAPVRHIDGFADFLAKQGGCNAKGLELIERIQRAAGRMNALIDEMLKLARISATTLSRIRLDLSQIATEIATGLAHAEPHRHVGFVAAPSLLAEGDPGLLRIALENLLANAWKFTAKTPAPRIEFGVVEARPREYFVRDNGIGFEPKFAARMFQPFQRFHAGADFAGNGIGLATVRRIVQKHGGTIRAEGAVERGATFYFTLP
jgi:signal transduction histidine kinase